MGPTVLVGRYVFHGIRPAQRVVPGLRLQRVAAGFLVVTHPLLRKDTLSICPLTPPLPTIRRRTVVGKASGAILKAVWQADVQVHLALFSQY